MLSLFSADHEVVAVVVVVVVVVAAVVGGVVVGIGAAAVSVTLS